MIKLGLRYVFICLMLCNGLAEAKVPLVGRKAAAKYFQNHGSQLDQGESSSDNSRNPSSVESLANDERYLAFGLSRFTNSDSYEWGRSGKETDIAKFGIDLTYRISQYNNLLDQAVRVSYNEYEPITKKATKMSFMYALTLPDAGSKFPLYFGFAAGPGIFFKQLEDESSLSLDYQLFLGLRLFNIFDSTGFYIESGLRNHLHITSDGQLNGTYFGAGAVFTF